MHRADPPASLVLAAIMVVLTSASSLAAETYTPVPTQPPLPPSSVQAPAMPVPPADTDPYEALVGPIALYPDPLIALILPASTVPAEIRAASTYMIQYGDASRVDRQPWDPSVRGLAHYPAILSWMAANMDWTQALGFAFMSSPERVMDAIQQLRSRALASGVLVSTPQQRVYSRDGEIEILPAQQDSVFVPLYDDSVVYSNDPYDGYAGPFIGFGDPCPVGPWLSYYFDWRGHQVWSGDPRNWREHHGWQHPPVGGERPPPGAHRWNPPKHGPGEISPPHPLHGNSVPLPQPIPGAPKPPPEAFRHPGAVPERSPSRLSVPGTAAPVASQQRPGAPVAVRDALPPTHTYASEAGRGNGPSPSHSDPARVSTLPPPPPRSYAPESPRGGESYSSHSEPARASSPAPAPAPASANYSSNQQPQK